MHRDDARDRSLRPVFEDLHRGDQPPPFQTTWAAARARMRAGRPRSQWILRWTAVAAAAVALLAVAIAMSRPPTPAPIPEAILTETDATGRIPGWRGPLDFLLETPGRELLGSVPDFRGNVPAPVLDPDLVQPRRNRS